MDMEREKQIRNVTLWGAVVNVILTIAKVMAGILGHSAAMVADGIHSLSDLLSDLVVLIFTRISSSGRDQKIINNRQIFIKFAVGKF